MLNLSGEKKYLRTTRSVVNHVSLVFERERIVFQPAFLKDNLLVFVRVSQGQSG